MLVKEKERKEDDVVALGGQRGEEREEREDRSIFPFSRFFISSESH